MVIIALTLPSLLTLRSAVVGHDDVLDFGLVRELTWFSLVVLFDIALLLFMIT